MFKDRYKNIVFGMSGKTDGQMLMRFDPGAKDNRRNFFDSIGLDASSTVIASLVHGNAVRAVGAADRGGIIADTDALITNEKNVILTITAADCLPVYFYDTLGTAVGMAHAGWRGVEADIVSEVVAGLRDRFGIETAAIRAHVGPHIRECHFEVDEDVAGRFSRYGEFIFEGGGKYRISLAGIVSRQLEAAGLSASNISVSPECTFDEKDSFFSYRRDRPEHVQAQVAYIGIL